MTNDDSSITRNDAAAIARVRALLDRPLSPQDVEENTALVAAPAEARRGAERSILVFRAGGELLAIEAASAHRVVPASPVRRVPHRTNAVFAGLANVGGDLMPVARLESALGMSMAASDDAPSHFIVVGPASQRWAFGVDEVLGVRRIDASRLLPPPATVRHAADGCTVHLAPLEDDGARASVLDALRLANLFARSLA